jgi:DNA primase
MSLLGSPPVGNFKEILADLGMPLSFNGKEWRGQAIWRNGSNKTSVIVDPSGYFDFGSRAKGSVQNLIAKICGVDEDEVGQIVELKAASPSVNVKRITDSPKIYGEECLSKLDTDYTYWENRGISMATQKIFEVGFARQNKMGGRTVFPIRRDDSKIIGFAGREAKESKGKYPKWILIGFKKFFTYSYQNCMDEIKKSNRIILVESIGDLLSLYESGVKNVMATFGLRVHKGLLKLIIINNLHVTISFNNDERMQGNEACVYTKSQLSKYINESKINIVTPVRNDWNDTLLKDGETAIRKSLLN